MVTRRGREEKRMIHQPHSRRALVGAGLLAPVLLLPGCATRPPSLDEAVRRLLSLSSQRALANLMAPGGFYDDQVARISLPAGFDDRGGRVLTALLNATVVRQRLTRQINLAAEEGAERAAPVIADAIRAMPVRDAASIIRGGGSPATDLLRAAMGNALVGAMLPGIDEGLRLFDDEIVTIALQAWTGIDFAGLREDVTRKAADAIYAAIAREEAAIRANPRATNDALLIAALALAG
jgi:hypothetical protein